MRLTPSILSLPASILLLIVSHTGALNSSDSASNPQSISEPRSSAQWPHDLPPSRRRDLEVIKKIQLGRKPVGVMKMSDDEGEKFYLDYWQFEAEVNLEGQRVFESPRESAAVRRRNGDEDGLRGNESAIMQFRPAFLLHTENTVGAEELKARDMLRSRDAAGVLAALQARDFTCPTGTKDCSIIMSPTSCCGTDETCFSIPDTGLGVVGCCPAGAQCSGPITQCDSPNTPCPSILGGGCCIPGFSCVAGGCEYIFSSACFLLTVDRCLGSSCCCDYSHNPYFYSHSFFGHTYKHICQYRNLDINDSLSSELPSLSRESRWPMLCNQPSLRSELMCTILLLLLLLDITIHKSHNHNLSNRRPSRPTHKRHHQLHPHHNNRHRPCSLPYRLLRLRSLLRRRLLSNRSQLRENVLSSHQLNDYHQ